MFDVKIFDKDYVLPNSYDDVLLCDYANYLQIVDKEYKSKDRKTIDMIAAISGIPGLDVDLGNLTRAELRELEQEFLFLLEEPNYSNVDKDSIEVNGVWYKVKKDFDRQTMNEEIYYEELSSSIEHNLHPFIISLGTVLRRVDADGNEILLNLDNFWDTVRSVYKFIKLSHIYAYIAFFLNGDKGSSKNGESTLVGKKMIIKKNLQLKEKTKKVK